MTARRRGDTRFAVRPVTADNWDDLVILFEARGGPHYCWCTPYRVTGEPHLDEAERKATMRRLVDARTPIGVLAYDGDVPIGWCSIAPRESYLRLGRSRTMPRRTPAATPTWTVLCFFVARPYRGKGVTDALLGGALAYARAEGAAVLEGYPFDSGGISSTHRGHSSVFEAGGFQPDGKRWFRRLGGR